MFAQVLAVSLLLFVKDAFTQDCTGFVHRDTCYGNGTYISDSDAKDWLECEIGSSGTQWSSSACGVEPVRCSSSFPRLRVPNDDPFTDEHAGPYECCTSDESECIVANIYNVFIPYNWEVRVDARNDYWVFCRTIGRRLRAENFRLIYDDESDDGVLVNKENCTDSGYDCRFNIESISAPDTVNAYRERRVRVKWTGDQTEGGLFRKDVKNGDHCYTCEAEWGDITRTFGARCITAPASAPENLTADGCSLSWTYPDPTDVDGYTVKVGALDAVDAAGTSYTVGALLNPVRAGRTMPAAVRPYQELLGKSTEIEMEVCPGACRANCMMCYTCGVCSSCAPGWEGDDCCTDINECAIDDGGCAHICTNTDGSFECSCREGYVLGDDGLSCSDIDECAINNGGCAHNCTNTDGSFECFCREGYVLGDDGLSCSDIDECDEGNGGCDHSCTNTDGSFECSCLDGYRLGADGSSCSDINECDEGIDDCHETCTNTDGSFMCSCRSAKKYFLADDGKTCTSIRYAPDYPTTDDRDIKGMVWRPEGIAEDSTITCATVACQTCTRPLAEAPCTYGEEFTIRESRNRRRCLAITVTLEGGRSKLDVTCLWTAETEGCSVSLQGQRIEHRENSVALNFGPISAATELVCSQDLGVTYKNCSSPNQHVIDNPTETTELVVCPVNTDCTVCRCGGFQFNPNIFGDESTRFPQSFICPTESP